LLARHFAPVQLSTRSRLAASGVRSLMLRLISGRVLACQWNCRASAQTPRCKLRFTHSRLIPVDAHCLILTPWREASGKRSMKLLSITCLRGDLKLASNVRRLSAKSGSLSEIIRNGPFECPRDFCLLLQKHLRRLGQ